MNHDESECEDMGCCSHGNDCDLPDTDAYDLKKQLLTMLSQHSNSGVKVMTKVTLYLDDNGWPLEFEEGRPFKNFFRKLLHSGRKIRVDAWATMPDGEDPFARNDPLSKYLVESEADLPDECDNECCGDNCGQ